MRVNTIIFSLFYLVTAVHKSYFRLVLAPHLINGDRYSYRHKFSSYDRKIYLEMRDDTETVKVKAVLVR